MIFPNITFKKIDAVNSILDNPSRRSKMLGQAYNTLFVPDGKGGIKEKYFNPFDFMGLANSAVHRRTNHDPVSAALMTGMEYGPVGVMLAMLHLNLDNTSEAWKKMFGTARRDLQEAMLNVALETMLVRRRGGRLPTT